MLGFGKKKAVTIKLKAPLAGTVVPIESVPDPAFSERLVGDGAAIEPSSEYVVAPCNAVVAALFPTGHAIALETKEGLEILIHVGIETVNMKGVGFDKLVRQGEAVTEGAPLLRFDREAIAKAGYPTVSPVLITNVEKVGSMTVAEGEMTAGESVFLEITLS